MVDNLDDENNATPGQGNSPEQLAEEAKAKRHSEQMEWSKAEVERLGKLAQKAAVKAAELDWSTLLELYKEDPKFAEKVAKEGFNKTIDEVRAIVEWWNTPEKSTDSVTSKEEEFERFYEKRLKKDQHAESLKSVEEQFDKLWSEDLKSQAREEFEFLVWDRMLTPAQAKKLARMATLSVSKETGNADEYNKLLKTMSSTGVSDKTAWWTEDSWDDDLKNLVVRNWKFFNLKTDKYV